MHFTVLLLTLLLDRLRPVAPVESLLERLRHALALLARATWAGESHNPWLAVALVSAPVAALLLIARSALGGLGLLLDLIARLLVVRLADVLQWAEYAARALDEGDDASAAAVLAGSPMALASLPGGAAARGRTVIQVLLLTVHARLFAPVLWYVLLPGCIGPVLYLLVREVYAAWTRQDAPPPYAEAATRLLRWADWLPARATALAIAVVGNFEDAVYAWRQQSTHWTLQEEGVILASAAGALGMTLGDPRRVMPEYASEADTGGSAAADIRSALGLVWRIVVLGFAALLLLGVGKMVG